MNIFTWEEIKKANLKHIYLLGYGSLLNQSTHHNSHKMIAVMANGFKRSFSLSYNKEICSDDKYKERFKKTATNLRETYDRKENILTYMTNSGSLTVEKNENYSINGLLLKIDKEDFESYSIREHEYKLHQINVDYFNKEDKLSEEDKIFILVADNEKLSNSNIYYLYQKSCRIGAYNISLEFGKKYDETTYSYNNKLAYEELNKNIFKPGNEFIIKQNLITMKNYPELKEEIIKNDNEKCIILNNNKYMAEV